MSEFEKETLADLSKLIRLQTERPLPPESIWMKIKNVFAGSAIMVAAAWWIATIIR